MNEMDRLVLAELRSLGSHEAATYLITKYGVECQYHNHAPLRMMLHCSWKRRDQIRLARHFLLARPFNENAKLLWYFASFMSVRLLIRLMREHTFIEFLDIWTFQGCVERVLTSKAKSEREMAELKQLIAEYRQLRAAESNPTVERDARENRARPSP